MSNAFVAVQTCLCLFEQANGKCRFIRCSVRVVVLAAVLRRMHVRRFCANPSAPRRKQKQKIIYLGCNWSHTTRATFLFNKFGRKLFFAVLSVRHFQFGWMRCDCIERIRCGTPWSATSETEKLKSKQNNGKKTYSNDADGESARYASVRKLNFFSCKGFICGKNRFDSYGWCEMDESRPNHINTSACNAKSLFSRLSASTYIIYYYFVVHQWTNADWTRQ